MLLPDDQRVNVYVLVFMFIDMVCITCNPISDQCLRAEELPRAYKLEPEWFQENKGM